MTRAPSEPLTLVALMPFSFITLNATIVNVSASAMR
jgi:hypothetical protein